MKTLSADSAAKIAAFVPQTNTSLLRLSIIAVVTRIWSCGSLNEALQSILDAKRSLSEDCFFLTQKAESLVKRLGLPNVILDEALMITEWISHDLILYLNGLVKNEFFSYTGAVGDIIKNIEWDVHGTINEVVTFKNMSYVNSHYNYILSTIFCLEDDVPHLWNECACGPDMLSTLQAGDFSYAKYLILYWTCQVTETDLELQMLHFDDPQHILSRVQDNSLNLKMLAISVHIFNAHSYKYFWHRLDLEERHLAFSILCNRYSVDGIFEPEEDYLLRHSVSIILFTLRQLDEQQRLIFVQMCYYQLILQFWQYWPIHHAILPLFQAVVPAMEESAYRKLFSSLLKSVGPFTPRNRLLFKMWLCSPPHLQSQITESERQEILRDKRVTQKLLQILR